MLPRVQNPHGNLKTDQRNSCLPEGKDCYLKIKIPAQILQLYDKPDYIHEETTRGRKLYLTTFWFYEENSWLDYADNWNMVDPFSMDTQVPSSWLCMEFIYFRCPGSCLINLCIKEEKWMDWMGQYDNRIMVVFFSMAVGDDCHPGNVESLDCRDTNRCCIRIEDHGGSENTNFLINQDNSSHPANFCFVSRPLFCCPGLKEV